MIPLFRGNLKNVSATSFYKIDNASNLVFGCCFLNKLEPGHIVYIMQQ